jgi:hypothetical protein
MVTRERVGSEGKASFFGCASATVGTRPLLRGHRANARGQSSRRFKAAPSKKQNGRRQEAGELQKSVGELVKVNHSVTMY